MRIQNKMLSEFASLVDSGEVRPFSGNLKVGVDLGTSNIVVSVIDSKNYPIAGMTIPSTVVKDGIVVDYVGAIRSLKYIKGTLEKKLGISITQVATAIPPGISAENIRCISNCVEGAEWEVTHIVDEPTAAADLLNIQNGAVVDVGGGTTGISILHNGKVVYTADEPTGGTHMTWVLAGYYGVSFAEAEIIKKDKKREKEVFSLVCPVIEKMAGITAKCILEKNIKKLYVVGGACSFMEFEKVFGKIVPVEIYKTNDSLFVTPLGIAMSQRVEGNYDNRNR